ncbi:hypothetical protein HID58_002560, partial [Brassica napus]
KMKGSKKRVVSKPSSSRTIVKANPNDNKSVTIEPPIVSSYNDQIRPLLDTVDRMRNLNTHPMLSMIDENIVGLPVLAQKLIHIQTTMISRCLPEIFSDDLQAKPKQVREFLMDEIKVLEECKCVGLPNFIPRSAFMAILSQHVDDIHAKPVEFIKNIWDYIEVVLSSIITKYSENFPQVQPSIKRAGRNLMSKIKEQSVDRVIQIVEMEKLTDYTCSPEYMKSWTEKIDAQKSFVDAVLNDKMKPDSFSVNGFGSVKISHLREYHAHLLQQAFDMKMRITSYWKIVLRRIVDNLALYLQLSVKYLVNTQFQKEIVAEMVDPKGGGGVERMLEESPSVASKREKLKKSIKVLKESKDAVAAIVDQ